MNFTCFNALLFKQQHFFSSIFFLWIWTPFYNFVSYDFQVAILTVLSAIRMQLQMRQHKPLTFRDALRNPYAVKFLRRFIDASAFRIYGHWVKKATDQNRAALFENTSRASQQRMLDFEDKSSLLALPNKEIINNLTSNDRTLVSTLVR